METLTPTKEKYRSFDVTAGVYALKNDLDHNGYFLPETKEQVLNEQLSYLVEGIERSSRTTFYFTRLDQDLYYFDDGGWRSHSDMLAAGREAAKHDAAIDHRRQFLVGWAENDIYQHQQNLKLKPGEKRVWASAYPQEVEASYGTRFVQDVGLNSKRKLGFIYQAVCHQDGGVVLESQTLDRSDQDGIDAALTAFNSDPSLNLDDLVEVYDQVLTDKYGVRFYAGRSEAEKHENAWKEIQSSSDLINYLLLEFEAIATSSDSHEDVVIKTKKLLIGAWKLFKKRLDGTADVPPSMPSSSIVGRVEHYTWLNAQIHSGYDEFLKSGETIIGCGGSLDMPMGGADNLNSDLTGILSSIFGFGRRTEVMKCVTCPLCKESGVDAKIAYRGKEKIITCSKCNQSKTYAA